jgi:hypothetical protein
MKKCLLLLLVILTLSLTACQTPAIEYTDNLPFVIDMKNDDLKILQLTDLHLTYGIDANDRKTFETITNLVNSDDFGFIVITGDMSLSPSGPSLFLRLLNHMESLKTPWTFIFGNHETDYDDYEDYLAKIKNTEYLYFKVGPELTDGGVGNFVIRFDKAGVPFYNLYLMDSHAEREVYTEEEGEYGYFSLAQVAWYEDLVSTDAIDSVVFMHIPLRQFIDSEGYVGIFNEDMVYAQGIDTGFFDSMVQYGKSKGVFVGHDHLNDFYVIQSGIMLVYGRVTGHNGYGNLERGGRVIEISSAGIMTTYVLLESEAIA